MKVKAQPWSTDWLLGRNGMVRCFCRKEERRGSSRTGHLGLLVKPRPDGGDDATGEVLVSRWLGAINQIMDQMVSPIAHPAGFCEAGGDGYLVVVSCRKEPNRGAVFLAGCGEKHHWRFFVPSAHAFYNLVRQINFLWNRLKTPGNCSRVAGINDNRDTRSGVGHLSEPLPQLVVNDEPIRRPYLSATEVSADEGFFTPVLLIPTLVRKTGPVPAEENEDNIFCRQPTPQISPQSRSYTSFVRPFIGEDDYLIFLEIKLFN